MVRVISHVRKLSKHNYNTGYIISSSTVTSIDFIYYKLVLKDYSPHPHFTLSITESTSKHSSTNGPGVG